MNATKLAIAWILALTLLSGCSNQTAARIGNRIGIVIGKPIGVIASSAEQAFRTTGKIVSESTRQQREQRQKEQRVASNRIVEEQMSKAAQTSGKPNPSKAEPTAPLSEQQRGVESDFWQQSE